jgi:hypothetical protein
MQIFLTALVLFMIETAMFHLLQFTHDSLESTLVISYALLGLALGSIATYLWPASKVINFPLLAFLLIVSIALAFINITQFPNLIRMSPVLVCPFLIGNVIVTSLFRIGNVNHLYLFDLAGATTGILLCTAAIPLLKSEGTLIVSIVILCLAGFTFTPQGSNGRLVRAVFLFVAVGSLLALAANERWHFLRLEEIARSEVKDFFRARNSGAPCLFSRDSMVTRVSIFPARDGDHTYRAFDGSASAWSAHAYFDGQSNDVVDSAALESFRNDPRIPFMYSEEGQQHTFFDPLPRVLIIGASAQGIMKSVKLLVRDWSLIDAVEINPAVVTLMRNELFELSGRAYENVDVTTMDARAYIKNCAWQYDLITMMNTQTKSVIGNIGEPDFIHTCDAIEEYFDHLSDRGFVLLEERGENPIARMAIYRLLNNFRKVLEKRGVERPEEHFFIYRVNEKTKDPNGWYTFIAVKRTPIAAIEAAYFMRWIESRHKIEYVQEQAESPDMDVTHMFHTQLEFLQGRGGAGDYARFIRSRNAESFWGPGVRLTPTSDDSPYLFDVFMPRREMRDLLRTTGLTCAALLGAIVAFGITRRGRASAAQVPYFAYFLFLGLGYFILEMTLLKFYQSSAGSPTNAMVFILGGLLLSSGIGSYCSKMYSERLVALSFLGIVVTALYHVFAGNHLIGLVGGPLLLRNILTAASIFPLGYLMGIPFPFGLEQAKRMLPDLHVPLCVAVNCLASAFGIVLGLYLSVAIGFRATALIAVGAYICAVILLRLFVSRKAGPVAALGKP